MGVTVINTKKHGGTGFRTAGRNARKSGRARALLSLGQRTREARMVTGIAHTPQGKARPTSSWPRPRSFKGRKTATVLRLATRFGQLRFPHLLAGIAATCGQCRRRQLGTEGGNSSARATSLVSRCLSERAVDRTPGNTETLRDRRGIDPTWPSTCRCRQPAPQPLRELGAAA
jgi:hypothetical protein